MRKEGRRRKLTSIPLKGEKKLRLGGGGHRSGIKCTKDHGNGQNVHLYHTRSDHRGSYDTESATSIPPAAEWTSLHFAYFRTEKETSVAMVTLTNISKHI